MFVALAPKAALLIVDDDLPCGFAQFKLVAHFLVTWRLALNLRLLARDSCVLLLFSILYQSRQACLRRGV